MCTICGCSGDGATLHSPGHEHAHAHRHAHGHDHHGHDHSQPQIIPAAGGARHVAIEQDILSANDAQAAHNRAHLAAHGILALNLVSSPGSGKTTLLVATIERLGASSPVAVIEGDQQTSRDAERIRATGVPAVQVNTGKGCHLDARMVARAIEVLPHEQGGLLLIENVGNLVCPAPFDLGEAHKVVILSVTEGEDKPLKYPDIFRAADVLLLNKCDLLPHLDFDIDLAEANARRVNPRLVVFRVSARSGEGMPGWLAWVAGEMEAQQARRDESVAVLKARIAELERQLAQDAGPATGESGAPAAPASGAR